jgi:hypothetical protein
MRGVVRREEARQLDQKTTQNSKSDRCTMDNYLTAPKNLQSVLHCFPIMRNQMSMKHVDRHAIDLSHVQRQFNNECELLDLGLKNLPKYSRNLGIMFGVAQQVVALGIVVKPKAAVVKRCIPIAGQLSAAIFKLGDPSNSDALYQLEDKSVVATEPVSESYLSTGQWLLSYYWNKIADQNRQLNWLLAIPTETLTKSTTKGPKIQAAMIDCFKAYESGIKGFPKLVKNAIEIGARESRNKWVKNTGIPTCKLLAAIHDMQSDVSDLVCDLLHGHRKQTELTQDYERSADGFVSVAACALVKMAREMGIKVNVQSGYIPDLLTDFKGT